MDYNHIQTNNVSHVEAILSSFRTEEPGNYLFKIESFSSLLEALTKTEGDKCDSCHFEAGGYKWKLSLYPNGDNKRGGDGYISLYLALADPKSLPQGEGVHVFFKFFVFDYLHDSYLVLQDGKDRRFHGLNTEWGFAKLLPLEIFNDPSRRYLVDDHCAFGVEMFFHNKKGKRGLSTFIKDNVGTHESSFTWKIDKFSKLPELHKTVVFSIGGHKWKLSVYPNGDKKRGGDGYISLYLALADPKSLHRGQEVHVFFKFFVFDYLLDSYLVLQDGKDRRFHRLNTEWGFAKLLPLEIFKDPCQGYLVDDRCAFGVEMFFHKNECKRGSSLFFKSKVETREISFSWKISKFSALRGAHKSDVFNDGGYKWQLELYPKGDYRAKGKSLSLFLHLNDHSSFPCGGRIYVECELSILDQLNEEHYKKKVTGRWFSAGSNSGWGYPKFMSLSDLKNESRGFLAKDTVLIQVKFTGIFTSNHFLLS